jgi:hypothetical protein
MQRVDKDAFKLCVTLLVGLKLQALASKLEDHPPYERGQDRTSLKVQGANVAARADSLVSVESYMGHMSMRDAVL